MNRFFVDKEAIEGDVVEINGSDFNHISHSLRLQSGDKIIVSTGDGIDFTVELNEFFADRVKGQIIDRHKNTNEPDISITLAQAVPKNRNMELIVEKGTELGVRRFIPLMTERTVVKLSARKEKKRVSRWQRIAKSAAKQSRRGIIPVVENLYNLEDIVDIKNEYDLVLIFWEEEKNRGIRELFSALDFDDINDILIIIGPEGGLSGEEIKDLEARQLTLGPRILRTETAGIVAPALVLYEAGEMGG